MPKMASVKWIVILYFICTVNSVYYWSNIYSSSWKRKWISEKVYETFWVIKSFRRTIFLKKIWSFLWGYSYPCFGLLMMTALVFKTSLDPFFASFLTFVIPRFTSGVTPADCIEVSMAAKPSWLTYLQTCPQALVEVQAGARTYDHLRDEHNAIFTRPLHFGGKLSVRPLEYLVCWAHRFIKTQMSGNHWLCR